MLKRFGGSGLGDGPFGDSDSEASPMAGVSNLADVMLVLAVGIMMALIANWNINISSSTTTAVSQEEITEVEDYESLTDEDLTTQAGLEGLEETGVVYVDPKTGKVYLVIEEDRGTDSETE